MDAGDSSGASFVIWSTSTHSLASADDAAGGVDLPFERLPSARWLWGHVRRRRVSRRGRVSSAFNAPTRLSFTGAHWREALRLQQAQS